MLQKTSDIVIDIKKDSVFLCYICNTYVPKKEFDFINHICNNCKKDIKNNGTTIKKTN